MNETVMQTRTLFIGAGHSDTDPGAVSKGISEADIVLAFRDCLARALEDIGVVFARDGIQGQNLPLRTAVVLAAKHDVAVEFHCNAAESEQATGVETLSNPENFPLGRRITSAVSQLLGIPDRGAKDQAAGQHSRLAFAEDGGGIIVELFFLTNDRDFRAFMEKEEELAAELAYVLADVVS